VCLAHKRGALQHSAAQKEESQKEPQKGGLLGLPLFQVLSASQVSLLLQDAPVAQPSWNMTPEKLGREDTPTYT
jgi:hypothetical protein